MLSVSCRSQETESKSWDKLDKLVNKHLAEKHIPAISIGVVKNGEVIFLKGYGFADLDNQIPADDETIYQLGSVTKTITGHVLANLVKEGEMSLDDTLSQFFPSILKFPKYSNGNPITIKHLATHSAEFPRYPDNLERVDPDPIKGYSYEQMLTGIQEVNIDTVGGYRFNYSNFGYGVLATAMQNHSNTDFSELLEDKVFTPYNMTNSSLQLTAKNIKKLATPYLEVNPSVETEPWDMGTMAGAGNIFSNVKDMSQFLLGIMEKNEINKIQQTPLFKIREHYFYGLGCFVIDSKKVNTRLIYHGGDVDGYSSSLKYYPEYELGTVLLTNYGEGRVIGEVFMDIEVYILELLKSTEKNNP